MKKELFNFGNGAVVLSEEAGVVTLSLSEQASLGGGEAAGVISVQGSGSVVLKGKVGFDLAMKLLEAHSPAAFVPIEVAAAAIVDAAIEKL